MRRFGFSTIFYLLLVFASGIVVGGFAHRLYMIKSVSAVVSPRTAKEYREKYLGEMRVRLKLNDEQVQQLGAVLDETRQRYRELHDRLMRPDAKLLQQEQTEKIRALLTPEQQAEYEKYREERDSRRRRNAAF
jgi:hypothetical protein